jgi:chromosome segregation ATPase
MAQNVDTDPYAPIEAAIEEHRHRLESGHSEMMDVVERIRASLSTLAEKASAEVRFAEQLREQTRAQLEAHRHAFSEDAEAANRLSTRIETLEAELESRDRDLHALRQRLEEIEAGSDPDELNNLRAKYEKAKQHIDRIEKALKEQGDAAEANQAAKRKIAELEASLAGYSEAAKADQERATQLQERIESLAAAEQARATELEQARRDLQQHQAVADSSKQVADAVQQELNAKREEFESLQQEHAKLEQELAASNKANLDLKSRIKELEESGAILQADTDKAKARAAELEAASAKLNDEMELVRSRARETADAERSKAQMLENAQSQVVALQQRIEKLEPLEKRVEEIEAEREHDLARIAELEDEMRSERAGGTKSLLANELAQALQERDEARNQLRALRNRRSEPDPAPVPAAPPTETPRAPDDIQILETMRDRRFGEVLLGSSLITQDDLDKALRIQDSERPNEHIGAILVSIGAAKEDTVAQALAFQHGLQFIRLRDGAIEKQAPRIINRRVAERHHCLPIRVDGGSLVLAMENPLDLIAIEDVERASEMPVRAVIATRSDIAAAIALHYGSTLD